MFKAYPRHSVDISIREYKKIASLLFSCKMLNGNYAPRFESLFAEYINVRFAISMPSARLGLYALLKYFNFPEGSEVIITPFTHWSIFSVIKSCGLKPVFVDIDESTYNITPAKARDNITKKTRLLIITHIWGQPCEMDGFIDIKREFGIKIIEDCAMACGATYDNEKVGSFGDASIFSFGKAKAISTFGGGMLCTDNSEICGGIRNTMLDFKDGKYGSLLVNIINAALASILTKPPVFFISLYPIMRLLDLRDPYNPIEHKKDTSIFLDDIPDEWKIKYSNIQAAIGVEQLASLDLRNEKRIENSGLLNELLFGIEEIGLPLARPGIRHIYLYHALLIKRNISIDVIRKKLLTMGVDSQLNELTSSNELEIFGEDSKDYPVFNRVSKSLLIIPNGINLGRRDIEHVGSALKKTWQLLKDK